MLTKTQWYCVAAAAVLMLALVLLYPVLNVYYKEMRGKASLAEAQFSRQVEVARAQAELDAAELQAEAIRTVGAAAKEFPEYRNQQFITAFGDAMNNGNVEKIIYVPTEANIPIIEAGRR